MCEESQRNQAQLQDLLQSLAAAREAMAALEQEKNAEIEGLQNKLDEANLNT